MIVFRLDTMGGIFQRSLESYNDANDSMLITEVSIYIFA